MITKIAIVHKPMTNNSRPKSIKYLLLEWLDQNNYTTMICPNSGCDTNLPKSQYFELLQNDSILLHCTKIQKLKFCGDSNFLGNAKRITYPPLKWPCQ